MGYSGGPDSTCLLHLLKEAGIDIIAAHLHHGQRAEADLELKLCDAFATELGVPFASGRADVPRMTRDLKIGLEEAGRNARYAFFRQAAKETGCDLVATAHTRDDLVETVLMRVARGTGISGLAGIPERRDNIIRPLLPFTKAETREYCEGLGLWTHDDPSNEDMAFTRARIRHRILPEMRKINEQVDSAIMRLSALAAEEDRFLNGMAAAALEQSELPQNGDLGFLTNDVEITFNRGHLEHLPRVLFKRAMRLAAEALGSSVDYFQAEQLAERIAIDLKGSITTEGGEVAIEWFEDRIQVRNLHLTVPFRYPLTIPGETASDEFGWQFTAFQQSPSEKPIRASMQCWIDVNKVKGPLYFRPPAEGDTMQPLGFSGHRKLSDLLSEAKLTHACRARLPVICDLVGPVWAPGVCLDERVRAEVNLSSALFVRFERILATKSP